MKLAVVGVGLIGGSWAKALREHALVTEVLGVDRSEQHLEQAIKLGIMIGPLITINSHRLTSYL